MSSTPVKPTIQPPAAVSCFPGYEVLDTGINTVKLNAHMYRAVRRPRYLCDNRLNHVKLVLYCTPLCQDPDGYGIYGYQNGKQIVRHKMAPRTAFSVRFLLCVRNWGECLFVPLSYSKSYSLRIVCAIAVVFMYRPPRLFYRSHRPGCACC